MQLLSQSEFKGLAEHTGEYVVSIYMPTHIAGPEIRQDPIRLKNLLSEAEESLLAAGMDNRAVREMLAPGFDLLENLHFWRHQSSGLALFFTPETMRLYRLPLAFESVVVASDRFHLKPLLPLFFSNRYFYILALSQNQVRFFQSTRHCISEIELEDVPTSLDEALQYDDPEEHLQFHAGGGSGTAPTYHGQGVGTTHDKEAIRRFLLKVSKGLHPYLNGESAPLVLASVDEFQPIYREVEDYPHLLDRGVSGNPDVAEPDELREAAWEKVSALVEQSRERALEQYHTLIGTGKASDRFSEVLKAACRGQVDVLFAAADTQCWGTFDAQSGELDRHEEAQPEDIDLLDVAAMQTFLQGGNVYILGEEKMPAETSAAAVYRYGVPTEV